MMLKSRISFQTKNNKVIPNLIWNLPLKPFMGKQQTARVEDPGQKPSGMTLCDERQTTRGFTLIELLVVVLIIGILAAIAVPQYQNAVDKARYMELISIGEALHKAEEVYYLANNQYTNNQENLDLEVPIPQNIHMTLGTSDAYISLSDDRQSTLGYIFYLDNHSRMDHRGRRECRSYSNSERLKKLCQSITGNEIYYDGSAWCSNF